MAGNGEAAVFGPGVAALSMPPKRPNTSDAPLTGRERKKQKMDFARSIPVQEQAVPDCECGARWRDGR